MTILDAVILGLVEGITEYLPISSTGHLIIAAAVLGLDGPAVDAFAIVIQGGAILAVLGLYRRRVVQMIGGLLGRDAAGRRLAVNLAIAFAPAAVLGPLLNDTIERWLFAPMPVVAALALGGLLMILLKPRRDATLAMEQLTWRHALAIGAAQCLAMWPGTSRSMVTIVAGMLVGLPPKRAAEFSFLLALPTLGGACAYRAWKSGRADESMTEVLGWAPLLVGLAVATLAAAVAVRWLVGYLNTHGLVVFGWYRLALATAVTVLVASGGGGGVGLLLGDQVAVAGPDRLAHRRPEDLAELVDALVAGLDVVAPGDERLELDERSQGLDLVEVDADVLQHPQLAELLDDQPGLEALGAPAPHRLGVREDRVAAHPGPDDVAPVVVDPLGGLAGRLAALEPAVVELEVRIGLLEDADALGPQHLALPAGGHRIAQLGFELDVVHARPPTWIVIPPGAP